MKRNLLIGAMLLIGVSTYAQKDNVGIGTTKPEQSAILDVNSTNKGLLMPRMSLQQRNAIQSPAKGLIIYQTDMLSGFYFYDGSEWKSLGNNSSDKSVAGTDGDWTIIGNAGTNPTTNFIGTTDASLAFRAGNEPSGFIDISATSQKTTFGYQAGKNVTTNYNTAFGFQALRGTVGGTGLGNLAFGNSTLSANNNGNDNVAVGGGALNKNTNGSGNLAFGGNAMSENLTGGYNIAIGSQALRNGASPSLNIAIGSSALQFEGGSGNIAIGENAGANNTAGFNNVFLGKSAGQNETGSDKLYIAGSNTTTPLVYGSFATDFLAIGGVDAAPAKRDNLSANYGLLVKKGILTEKIKVATMTSTDWADYVFDKDYKRMSLEEVEAFVKENKHLPNVPTTEEMMSNGNDLIKTDAKLLEKIEELTLYIIELNKKIKNLENNSSNK